MDEDGVDVVEAIDAWIDEQIDDLSDDELERTLEILDVVAASQLAGIDATYIDAADIDELVDLAGGSDTSRSQTAAVLRAALSDQSMPFPRPLGADGLGPEAYLAAPGAIFSASDDAPATPRFRETATDEDDTAADEDSGADNDGPDADGPDAGPARFTADERDHDEIADDEPEHGDDDELVINWKDDDGPADDEWEEHDELVINWKDDDPSNTVDLPEDGDKLDGVDELGEIGGLLVGGGASLASTFDANTFDTDDDFLHDLAHAERTDQLAAIKADRTDLGAPRDTSSTSAVPALPQALPVWATNVRPAPLRDHDLLGPSFLPEKPPVVVTARRGLRYALLPFLMVIGLAAFAFGMLQLVNSLDEESSATATTESVSAAADDAEPEASTEPTEVAATPPPVDAATPAVTAAPEPPPHPGFAIRLVTGDVIVANYAVPGEPPTLTKVYDASDDDHSPARQLEWGDGGLAIVDTEGDVLLLDLDSPQNPSLVFEATPEIGEAVEVAMVPGYVAVRTDLGNIALVESAIGADPDDSELVWDAEDEGALATDISSIGEMVPFVLDTGDASMIDTSSNNAIIAVWVAEGQAPAYNVAGSPAGILLGIGEGAVARYRLGDIEGDRFEAVWDPSETGEAPAIGYSGVGTRTAIILADGSLVLADDTGSGPRLWEPADTEVRAFIAAGSETQIIVLLETGSVVRIPVGSDELIESVWDITDETLSAANQIVLEPTE